MSALWVAAPLLAILWTSRSVRLGAQEPLPRERAEPTTAVAARVDDRPVYAADVEAELRQVLGRRTAEPAAAARLREETVARLIDRELVLLWLESERLAASPQDVDLALARLDEQLRARGQTLEQFLARQQLDEPRFRARLRWRLSWRRLLDRYLTEENLSRHFERHRRDFDGTRVRVAHIFWKTTDAEEIKQARMTAAEVLQRVRDHALTFADAARQYSAAPTADQGGDIGWIQRHEPMSEAFSVAAFQLDAGETSEPVVTDRGVHLIHCLAVEPGQRRWQDARAELEKAVSRFLFRWAADKQRPLARIDIESPPASRTTE